MSANPSRLVMLAVALVLVAVLSPSLASPAYTSPNFEVYDNAGAGVEYARSTADALENARSTLLQKGATLAPPCSGSRYTVYVEKLGGEGGQVKWQYTYDPSTGKILSSCVTSIHIASGLSASTLARVALHEMLHVAQASYFRYSSVVSSYPWYIEASAEGVTGALLGSCGWEPRYFQLNLYSVNPYSFSGSAEECYALGAFYHWVVASGYSSVSGALSGSLSGSTVNSDWVNSAYTSFLLSLARGVSMCGRTYQPSYQQVQLSPSGWSTRVTLQGLSATYYRLTLPAPGLVTITVSGSPRSNLQLNQPFYASNTSLLLAIANPTTSPATYDISVSYSPPLLAEVKGGVFRPAGRTLEVKLYITYAGSPVSGEVRINGVSVEASSGLTTFTLSNATWGSYTLVVEYAGEKATVQLSLSKPSATLATQTPLYLTSGGYGDIVVSVRNPNAVDLELDLDVRPPTSGNSSFMEFAGVPRRVTLPPGENSVRLSFRVAGPVARSSGQLILDLGGEPLALLFSVEPASLVVAKAFFDSSRGVTTAEVVVQPASLQVQVTVRGLSGEAPVPLSTYYAGLVSVQLPPYQVKLSAKPVLVAPSWVLVSITAGISTVGSCPQYPASYSIVVSVNGSHIGAAGFLCGSSASLESLLNLTSSPRGVRLLLVANNEPSWSTVLEAVPPVIRVSLTEWVITDSGSLVSLEVRVEGPHRYLLLGREASNETILLEKSLPRGEKVLLVEAGFEDIEVPMPRVELAIEAPEVVLYPGAVRLKVTVNSSALLNATLQVEVAGKPAGKLLVSGKGRVELSAEVAPEEPGEIEIAVRSWFAEGVRKIFYVHVRSIGVQAPPLVLTGGEARITVLLRAYPPLPLPVNVTVRGCENRSLRVEGNSTLALSYSHPCVATVEARLLNYSSSTSVTWDVLNLHIENVLSSVGGQPVVPAGRVRGYAAFSNGTRVPAPVLVNGAESYEASELGEHALTLSVEYLGCRNSTLIRVFLVPEELYREAVEAVERLGHPRYMQTQLEVAIVTGRWEGLRQALDTLKEATAKAASYDPVGYVALKLLERWSEGGSPGDFAAARWLLDNELWLYLASALVLALVAIHARRVKQSGKG